MSQPYIKTNDNITRKANGMSDKVVTKDLSQLQILFVHKYIANNGNISKSAREVGISRPTAMAYLKNPKVTDYMKMVTSIGIDGQSIATTEEILTILTNIVRGDSWIGYN